MADPFTTAEDEALNAYDKAVLAESACIEALFNMTGCDCDGSLDGEAWSAPHHASDCPVYERWDVIEDTLRAVLAAASPPAPTGGE